MRQAIRFLLLGLMTVVAVKAFSQMPVQVTPQLLAPYSLQVSEYYSGVQPKLQVLLINRDINQPNIQVKLRMTVESQNCRMRTKDNAQTPTLTLTNGIPYYLSPQDLQPFFSAANIDFTGGYSEEEYIQTGRLPEGLYSFYFEAFELYTGNLVSNKGFSLAWLTLADPPLLNTPAKAEAVAPATSQNVIFNWTPRHNTSPTAAYFTDYVFTLVEYNDTQLGPEASFTSSPPLYIDSVQATTLLFGPGHPQLQPGKRYAWRVQAKAKNGSQQLAMFRNNGFSEVHWFTYQNNCAIPLGISATVQGQRVTIEWQNNIQHLDYKVEYREKNNQEAQWFTVKNTLPRVMLTDLKPGTQYEYRVGGACMVGQFSYSALLGFTTSGANANYLPGCGDSTLPAQGSGNTLQVPLVQGDVIKAGSFDVIVGYATGTGSYSGTGYVIVPWLANAKVEVRFTSITLALDKKLLSGIIETTYDPSESGIDDIDEYVDVFTSGYGVGGVVTGEVTADTTFGFVIKIPDGITVQLPTGYNPATGLGQGVITISVIPQGGGTPVSYTVDQLPTTLKDKDGNLYQVNKQGQVVPLGKPGGMALLEKTNTKNIDQDKGVVKFVDYPDKQVYAFDEWKPVYKKSNTFNKEYERLNGDYYVNAKAIAPGKTDYLKAVVTLTDNTIIADSIKFVNGKGTIYSRTKLSNGVYEIAVIGGPEKDAQEIYALYEQAGGKTLNLGKVLVASYPKREFKIKLVPVNGATIDESAVKDYLNNVYNKLNIKFTIEKESNFQDNSWDVNNDGKLEIENSSLFSTLTQEMKNLNKRFKELRTVTNGSIYLFVISSSSILNAEGDMPRGKQFGYLFTSGNSRINRTAVHETAHGIFRLKHLFDGYGFDESELLNNLMSKGDGTALAKAQWDLLHDPSVIFGPFDRDEDAMSLTISDLTGIKTKFTNSKNALSFLTPAGTKITISAANLKSINISTGDQWVNLLDNEPANAFSALGVLNYFDLQDGDILKTYSAYLETGLFRGYRYKKPNGTYEYFSDDLTLQLAPTNAQYPNDKYVIVGFPCAANQQFLLKLKGVEYKGVTIGPVYSMVGKMIDFNFYLASMPSLQEILLFGQSRDPGTLLQAPEVIFPANSSLKSEAARNYVFENINCSNSTLWKTIMIWKNAELIDRYSTFCEECILLRERLKVLSATTAASANSCENDNKQDDRALFEIEIEIRSVEEINKAFIEKTSKLRVLSEAYTNFSSKYAEFKSTGNILKLLFKIADYECILANIPFAERMELIRALLENTSFKTLDEWKTLEAKGWKEDDLLGQLVISTPIGDQSALLGKMRENKHELLNKWFENYGMESGAFPGALSMLAKTNLSPPAAEPLPTLNEAQSQNGIIWRSIFPFYMSEQNVISVPTSVYEQVPDTFHIRSQEMGGALSGLIYRLKRGTSYSFLDFITVFPLGNIYDCNGNIIWPAKEPRVSTVLDFVILTKRFQSGYAGLRASDFLTKMGKSLTIAAPPVGGATTTLGRILQVVYLAGWTINVVDIAFDPFKVAIEATGDQNFIAVLQGWNEFVKYANYFQLGAAGLQMGGAALKAATHYVRVGANVFDNVATSEAFRVRVTQVFGTEKGETIYHHLMQAYFALKGITNTTAYIAKTAAELRNHLISLVTKPAGKIYTGGAHRTIRITNNNPLEIHQGTIEGDYRYSKPGEPGLYLSETYNGNMTEMSHYSTGGVLKDVKTYSYSNIQIDNMLDLTDPKIVEKLAVDFKGLTRSLDNDKVFNYELTHEIGTWAKNYYKGIIFPGARGSKNYKNIVIFNQADIDAAFSGKIPTIITHD